MSQQSQTEFLCEISGWTKERCLNNLDNALPKLIKQLENAAYIKDGIRILQVLCGTLLPCVTIDALEKKVFGNICKNVIGMIDGGFEKICSNLNGNVNSPVDEVGSLVEECLQWALDIGTCLESCLNHTLACAVSSMELSLVRSLPQCALHFMRQVYKHCKESSDLYGEILDIASHALSLLFKKAHSVQMLVLGLLDKVHVTGEALEGQVVLLCSVCINLFEVCSLVTSLDVKASVSLWKCITRLCSQHLSLLRDRLDVCPFINFLCEEIQEGYSYLFQLSPQSDTSTLSDGDDKAFTKTVRVLGFQMKVLVALLRDFIDYLGDCETSLLRLLLNLHRLLPPSLSAVPLSEKQDAEIKTQVVNATVPCLTHLVNSRAFRTVFTQQSTDTNTNSEDGFPMLLLRLMLLDILPKCEDEVMDMWMRPVKKADGSSLPDLFSAIFSSLQHCKVELQIPVMLPGIVAAGQPHRQVSLYEHTVTHICGMIGACPAKHFPVLESTFFTHALGSDDLRAILAVDCWCFLARYGTASVCNSQVQALLLVFEKLVNKGRGYTCSKIRLTSRLAHLLSRLLKFMSPEHQQSLVQKYPPESNVALWLKLQPGGLAADMARDVETHMLTWALKVLSPSGGSVKSSELFLSLQALETVLANNSKEGPGTNSGRQLCPLMPNQQAQLLIAVIALWSEIQTPSLLESPLVSPTTTEKLLIRLLPLSSRLLPLMETKDILVVLQSMEALILDPKTSAQVLVKCAKFLSGFSCVRLGCSYLDSQTLDYFPRVFYPLLHHKHPMVHQHALASFSQFAALTPHEDMVPACLRGDESLVQTVQNYFNQVPHRSSDEDFQLLQYLRNEEEKLTAQQKPVTAEEGLKSSDKLKIGLGSGDEDHDKIGSQNSEDAERPAKRRRAISESDEEQASPSPAEAKINQPLLHNSNNDAADQDTQTTTTTASPSTPVPLGLATEVVAASVKEGRSDDQLRSILTRLQNVADDLEKVCNTSRDGRFPSWFVEQTKVELLRCQTTLYQNSVTSLQNATGWLDNIS